MSYSLSYCPNCRRPLTESTKLGWICNRMIADDTAFVPQPRRDDDAARENAINAMYPDAQPASSASRGARDGMREDELCGRYNAPDGDACINGLCGQPRDDAFSSLACPHCHYELPKLDNMRAGNITITGPSGAGKSHYIVALENWWRSNIGHYDLSVFPGMGSEGQKEFNEFRSTVFKKKVVLKPNVPGVINSFSWQVMPGRRDHNAEKAGLLFTFPDVAGERLLTPESLKTNRHFHGSVGVVLILDGARIAVSQGLTEDPDNRDPDDHYHLIQAMIQDLRFRLGEDEQRNLPIAVCVNKVDVFTTLPNDPGWSEMLRRFTPKHHGRFDFETCQKRSIATWELLTKDDSASICNDICTNFDNVMFFPMATIGSRSHKDIKLRTFGVEDPFLFMLWHQALIN